MTVLLLSDRYYCLIDIVFDLNCYNKDSCLIFIFPKPCSLPFCLQFLYTTNFLVRECFSLLVSSNFKFIVEIRTSKRQKYQRCERLSCSAMNSIPTRYELQTPAFFQDLLCSCHKQMPASFSGSALHREDPNSSSRIWRCSSRHLALLFC